MTFQFQIARACGLHVPISKGNVLASSLGGSCHGTKTILAPWSGLLGSLINAKGSLMSFSPIACRRVLSSSSIISTHGMDSIHKVCQRTCYLSISPSRKLAVLFVSPHSKFHTSARYKYARSTKHPFEVDSNVRVDTTVFAYRNDRFYKWITIFGIIQFLFWANIAIFCYNIPTLEDKEGKGPFEEGSWWNTIAHIQSKYKKHMAWVCLALGYLVMTFTWLYPQRTVSKLSLLKGGKNIGVTTYTHLGRQKTFSVPLTHISCMQTRTSPERTLSMKVKGKWFYFMLDKRDGRFHQAPLFDYVVGLKRDLK